MHRSIATVWVDKSPANRNGFVNRRRVLGDACFDGIELFEADFINFKGTAAEQLDAQKELSQ